MKINFLLIILVLLACKIQAQEAVKGRSKKGTVNISDQVASGVDVNIPQVKGTNPHRYALVIGNEDYTKYQNDLGSEVNVAFARQDAKIFAQYCELTLGVPKENIVLLQDAISSQMKREMDKLYKIIKYETGEAEVFIYYAGHGFPDETTKESYIMPVDISGSNVTDGIKLSDLYLKLTESPSKRVTVFLDACFSGGGRQAGLLAARGVKVNPKENRVGGNIVVFAASSSDQSSLPYKEKSHGMFTFFLLQKIQETKGQVSYRDLYDYINKNVSLYSVKINNKDQNPQLNVSPEIESKWASFLLLE